MSLAYQQLFHTHFTADAPLVKSGLVSVDDNGDIRSVNRLLRLVSARDDSDLDVCRLLLDAATPSELEWTDFGHVAIVKGFNTHD